MTWKITLEYDGTKFHGWQEQLNARTIMGELRKAAEPLFQAPVDLQGAGRTDAGVHALGQVAHLRVKSRAKFSTDAIRRALNDALPAEIAVLAVEDAGPRFHARHDAVSRSYIYQISTRKNAFAKRHVWWIKEALDLQAMTDAAKLIEGRHDFDCFRAADPSKPGESTIVVVNHAALEEHEDLILFRIEASHFLWRMVRRLVGVLVKVGRHELTTQQFGGLLEGECDPKWKISEWTAPASGLFLERIAYR
ncbi:MAG: tRNA pseudouridine(38-40) synthase TruA [Bryobacterales bacterium]|nr:tRNA pseudouridine(38-40) synthase TruA [Bryobacterales bacterium]